MRFGALLFIVFATITGYSQNVRVNVYDKFLKKHRIELEPLTIVLPGKGKVSIGFTSVSSTLYVELSGSGWGASTIDQGNELIFLFSNDSTATVRSTGVQSFEPGALKSTYKHQYFISQSDLEALSRYDLIGMRKYSFKDFSDISIPRLNIPKVKKQSAIFLSELKKANVFKSLQRIDLKDIGKHVGDSVEFCSKIYSARYFQTSENGPTLLDVQSDFSDPAVNAVVWQEDRKNFNDMPEKIYLNKDVCINGLVTLRNNVPYLVIHTKNQIKLRSPVSLTEIEFFVGDTVTVSGKIVTAKYFPDTKAQPTLLNMGAAFPDQPLTVVIEKDDRKNFGSEPEIFYLNKDIMVTGKVELFKNKPQIIVHRKEQVRLLGQNDFMNVSSTNMAYDAPKKTSTVKNADKPAVQLAQFPGGPEALIEFWRTNLICPDDLKANEKKTVYVRFKVNVDGSISDYKIVQSAGGNYDKEVIRVLKKMPHWRPKTNNNFFVETTLEQAVTFSRSEAND